MRWLKSLAIIGLGGIAEVTTSIALETPQSKPKLEKNALRSGPKMHRLQPSNWGCCRMPTLPVVKGIADSLITTKPLREKKEPQSGSAAQNSSNTQSQSLLIMETKVGRVRLSLTFELRWFSLKSETFQTDLLIAGFMAAPTLNIFSLSCLQKRLHANLNQAFRS